MEIKSVNKQPTEEKSKRTHEHYFITVITVIIITIITIIITIITIIITIISRYYLLHSAPIPPTSVSPTHKIIS
ncbi:hypothetical protein E2C01_097402 [Portunus trituberculatus]|uniref:Uncharacterized protein n=1 Tax=Portunus trituberculatus TaxID=210409 RepID=A0A5B7K5L3_PORTR|nr:hypothetical protein [Portunus trituberculatus]